MIIISTIYVDITPAWRLLLVGKHKILNIFISVFSFSQLIQSFYHFL